MTINQEDILDTCEWPDPTAGSGADMWDLDGDDLFGCTAAEAADAVLGVDSSLPNVDILDVNESKSKPSTSTPAGVAASSGNTPTSSGSGTKRKVSNSTITDNDDAAGAFDGLNFDGLGALRPSTSFNDFAHLLPPMTDAACEVPVSTLSTPVVSNSSLQDEKAEAKVATAAAPSKKKTKVGSAASISNKSLKNGTCKNAGLLNTSSIGSKGATASTSSSSHNGSKKAKVSTASTKKVPQNTRTVPAVALPRFNGIGKKTTAVPSGKVVSLQSSPAVNYVSSVIHNKDGASSLPTLTTSANAEESAVATAAAAAANLLKAGTATTAAVCLNPVPSAVLSNNSTTAVKLDHPANTSGKSKTIQLPSTNSIAAGASGYSFKDSKLLQGTNLPTPDTSTDHIHALTSSNWVAACSASGVANFAAVAAAQGAASQSALSAQAAAANKRRRQNLTADERAKQNRDRNREHARNTRLRKKAYVEELKRTLTELVHQRDAVELERKRQTQRESEQREVRYRVLEEFLKLRGGAYESLSPDVLKGKWKAILEEGFQLTLPVTSYREMVTKSSSTSSGVPTPVGLNITRQVSSDQLVVPNAGGEEGQQVLIGVGQVMKDASLTLGLLEVMGRSNISDSVPSCSASPSPRKITLAYNCEKNRFLMDGAEAVVSWVASSVGAVKAGSPEEMSFRGSARASFNPCTNKLKTVELMFDTGAVISQLSAVFPNFANLDAANAINDEPASPGIHHQTHTLSVEDADALLDSINVPQINLGSNSISNSSLHDVSSSEHSDNGGSSESSDEGSKYDKKVIATSKVGTRRSTRSATSNVTNSINNSS